MVDEQAVIRALTQASEGAKDGLAGKDRLPVVTISRTMGAGGDDIANALAERFGLPCYSREVLDKVAKEAKVNKTLMNKLHEHLSRASDAWLYSAIFGDAVTRDDYLHRLVTTVRGLYQSGGIIVGRGANIILAGRDVLRVRVTGSVEACAKRLALECHYDLDDAKKRVRESNKKRTAFMREVFNVRVDDPTNYDLTINTDHFSHYSHVVEIIAQGMHSMGMDRKTGTNRK